MNSKDLEKMKFELETKVKEKLSAIPKDDIKLLAKQQRQKDLKQNIIFSVIFSIFALIMIACIPIFIGSFDDISMSLWFSFFLSLICILWVTVYFILQVVTIRKKTDEDIVSIKIRRELLKSLKTKLLEEQTNNDYSDLGVNFVVSKTIDIPTNGWSLTKLLIDNQNEKFIYQTGKKYSKVYNFSDIINYEVYENGKSQVQGRAGSALIGGAFFGLSGLIVGSSMSRNINEHCSQLKLIIRLNDFDNPQIVITYANNTSLDKSSSSYAKLKTQLQSLCSMLEYMLNKKTLEQSFGEQQKEKVSNTKSNKLQLEELKEMLDDGLITQEDYEQKKKQILGL